MLSVPSNPLFVVRLALLFKGVFGRVYPYPGRLNKTSQSCKGLEYRVWNVLPKLPNCLVGKIPERALDKIPYQTHPYYSSAVEETLLLYSSSIWGVESTTTLIYNYLVSKLSLR